MRRPACPVRAVLIAALLLVAPALARAQGNFEIQVYPSETVAPGVTMFELHTNSALRGTTTEEDGIRPTRHAVHETLEITHGWTGWFETGFYLFTSIQPQQGWELVGTHVRPRVRAPESWALPVGLSLSMEIGWQRREYSTDTWSVELRPIIDKELGPWYLALNPAFGRSLKGTGTDFEFEPAAKVSYAVDKRVAAGLEYYASLGQVNGFDTWSRQEHLLFAVVDLDLGPRWEFNAGVGFGLTPATDGVILKLILGRRFDWGSGRH
jgi:hypothetical protein